MNRAPVIRRLDSTASGFAAQLRALLAFAPGQDEQIERTVAVIIADVRDRGDAALLEYTRRFDRIDVSEAAALEIPSAALHGALEALAPERRAALEAAAERVRAYHERQRAESWSYEESDGTRLGQRITALDRVGLYVPGGRAAYPSSVLMNAIPARVAGVGEIIMVVPTPDGVRNPTVLAAAAIAGVDRVFAVGGAQAIAALAYGTATVPGVDKIVGPGNAYVAEAKRRVFGKVGIDMIAGPSEIVVICDGSTPPDWVAMDMFAQAEHDELAQAILLSPDAAFLDAVADSIAKLIGQMPRREVIERSLSDRGALVRVRDMEEACAIASDIAPEHLEISAQDPQRWGERVRHAGAIFLGAFSSESLGDYCAGPNHVLPTMRTARFSSPLGVYDFQKRTSMIEVSRAGARTLGRVAAALARAEGLEAHARSAELRLGDDAPVAAPAHARTATPADVFRPEILAMHAYPVADAHGLVKLDAMENPYRLPEELRAALGERLAQVAINRYPVPSYRALKAAICAQLGVPAGYDVVVGNGSDELIAMLSLATARPGAVVLSPWPSFVMYEIGARLVGSRFVGVALKPDFTLDLAAMLAAIERERPALIYLAYPNNPTGNCHDTAAIEAILAAAPGLVVLDEAYQPFALDTWMPRLPEFPQLAVLRTVSKLGLAGLRVGYLSAAEPWLAELEKVRPPYNIGSLSEAAALFALENLAVFEQQAAQLRAARATLAAELAALPGVELFPSRANFLLVRVADGPATARGLRERGVLIRDVGRMHPLLQNCLRVTVSDAQENATLVAALRETLRASGTRAGEGAEHA